jgi:hypothetical protein
MRAALLVTLCTPSRATRPVAGRSGGTPWAGRPARRYECRRPEKTPLHKIVSGHLESWLEGRDQAERPVPGYVEEELRGYLECGILCFGFGRAVCMGCGQGFVIAFSCKGRGVAANWVGPGRGRRSRHRSLLRHDGKAPLARHLTDCLGETHGPGGRGVSFCEPGVWWRHPAQRRRPAGAGSLRTGGSQAGEGQDGFARVKADPDTPRRTARAAASLAGPWSADRLGRARPGPRRPGDFSGTDSRAARHRHPQPLTAFRATLRTAREKSGSRPVCADEKIQH